MEDLIKDVIKQVPALAVLCFIVLQFLKSQTTMRTELSAISERCHEVQQSSVEATNKNTEALTAVVELAKQCREIVQECPGRGK